MNESNEIDKRNRLPCDFTLLRIKQFVICGKNNLTE